MGMFGSPTSVAFGAHEDMLLDFAVADDGSGQSAIVAMECASGYGNTWWAIVSDGLIASIVYVSEGAPKIATVPYMRTGTSHTVSAFPLGDWDSDQDVDVRIGQQDFETALGTGVTLNFDAVMTLTAADGDSGQFSAWSLAGIERFATSYQGVVATQAKVDVTMSTAGGVHTVTLAVGGTTIASGSRTGNGSITLAEANTSGVSGSVTLTYTADIASGCYVVGRWAKSYAVVAGAASTTVYDDGRGTRLSATLTGLTPGSVAWSITPTSDSGVAGTAATGNVTIPGRPLAPGAIAYTSGDWTATVVTLAASATAGATYRLYMCDELDGPINHSLAVDTKAAQVGNFTWTLPQIGGAPAAGKVRAMIVAVNGGVEDATRRTITIEYDAAGAYVGPRPNAAAQQLTMPQPVSAGRTIAFTWTYDGADAAGVATLIGVWALAEGAATPADGATPDATIAVGTASNSVYRGASTVVAGGNGWYRIMVRAITALGTQSEDSSISSPVWCDDSVIAAPANVEATIVA